MRQLRAITAALLAALALGACTSTSWDPRRWFGKEETPQPATREVPGVEARLRAINNSSINGVVRLRESGDLLVVQADLFNGVATTYRVVLHATGNCSSPNGFSAGPPWSPPGWKESPLRLVPEARGNSSGNVIFTARIRGVRLGDAVTRSVLVYEGVTPQVPQPDVRNNAVACGTFQQSTTLF